MIRIGPWRLLPEKAVPAASWLRRAAASTDSRRIGWALVANSSYGLAQWLCLVLIARLLSLGEAGAYTLALAIVNPIFLFSAMNLRAVQVTSTGESFLFLHFAGTRVVTSTLAFGTIIIITSLLRFDPVLKALLLLWAAAKVLESYSEVIYGRFHKEGALRLIAISTLLRSLILVALLLLGLTFYGSLPVSLALIAGGYGVLLLAFDIPRGRQYFLPLRSHLSAASFRSVVARCWQLVQLSFPLAVSVGLLQLLIQMPRYFLAAHLDALHVGVYSCFASISLLGHLLITAIGQGLLPALCQDGGRGPKARQLFRSLVLAAGVLWLGITGLTLLLPGLIAQSLFGPEAADFRAFLPIIAGGAAAIYFVSALGYTLTALNRFREQLIAIAWGTTTCFLLCALLVPRFGLTGAALAAFSAYLVTTLLCLKQVVAAMSNEAKDSAPDRAPAARGD